MGNQLKILTARTRARIERSKLALDRQKKLAAEFALGRPRRKSPIADFVDDLVHRPPNREQMRQIKELLLEEQQSIAKLIALIDKHLE
jgi:hypothetical protein